MLNENDLRKIKGIVKDELKDEFKTVKSDVASIRRDTKAFKDELKTVKSDIASIRRDTKTIANFFDREYLTLRARVERVEEFLHLPPLAV